MIGSFFHFFQLKFYQWSVSFCVEFRFQKKAMNSIFIYNVFAALFRHTSVKWVYVYFILYMIKRCYLLYSISILFNSCKQQFIKLFQCADEKIIPAIAPIFCSYKSTPWPTISYMKRSFESNI